ncbi:MAG: hypothetical protein IT559_00605 [Alphaproteobacteria bacterium]|nr:hypothetical protein [Alphaproteobacteria bacterium]
MSDSEFDSSSSLSLFVEGRPFAGQDRRQLIDYEDYFNAQFSAHPVLVGPGETRYSGAPDEMLVAQVGSGVLAAISDPELKVGALSYVLLPAAALSVFPYFDRVDPALLAEALRPIDEALAQMQERGSGRGRMRIRLAGGATLSGEEDNTGIKNATFLREHLARKGLRVFSDDTGGAQVRRVHYFPVTGRIVSRILRRQEDRDEMKNIESALGSKMI